MGRREIFEDERILRKAYIKSMNEYYQRETENVRRLSEEIFANIYSDPNLTTNEENGRRMARRAVKMALIFNEEFKEMNVRHILETKNADAHEGNSKESNGSD